eukprot:1140462-Prorocentrum_minimum.AAC.1
MGSVREPEADECVLRRCAWPSPRRPCIARPASFPVSSSKKERARFVPASGTRASRSSNSWSEKEPSKELPPVKSGTRPGSNTIQRSQTREIRHSSRESYNPEVPNPGNQALVPGAIQSRGPKPGKSGTRAGSNTIQRSRSKPLASYLRRALLNPGTKRNPLGRNMWCPRCGGRSSGRSRSRAPPPAATPARFEGSVSLHAGKLTVTRGLSFGIGHAAKSAPASPAQSSQWNRAVSGTEQSASPLV